jgi:hypothetical protein
MISAGMSTGVCRILFYPVYVAAFFNYVNYSVLSMSLPQSLVRICFSDVKQKIWKLVLIANIDLIAVEIELIQPQDDILLSVARRLHQENVSKKLTIEELMLATLRILMKEYQENPQPVTAYFHLLLVCYPLLWICYPCYRLLQP